MRSRIPQGAAVLVIDVQNGLFGASPPPFDAKRVVERINEVTRKARQSGTPVIFVQHDGDEDDNVLPFTQGWQLHKQLLVDDKDLHIRKTTCDAFYQTQLEQMLRDRGISSLLLCGYSTEFCVDATLQNAVSKGFRVFVVEDAHTTNDSPVLHAHKIIDQHNWAWSNCTAAHRVTLVSAAEVRFASAPVTARKPASRQKVTA